MSVGYDKWNKLCEDDEEVDERIKDRLSKLKSTADGIFALDTPSSYQHALDLYLQISDICSQSGASGQDAASHALLGVVACCVRLQRFIEALCRCEYFDSSTLSSDMKRQLVYFRSVCRYKLNRDLSDALADVTWLVSHAEGLPDQTISEYEALYKNISQLCDKMNLTSNIQEGWQLLESQQYSAAADWFISQLQVCSSDASSRHLLLIGAGKAFICSDNLVKAASMFSEAASHWKDEEIRLLLLTVHCQLAHCEALRSTDEKSDVLADIEIKMETLRSSINTAQSQSGLDELHQTVSLLLSEVRVSLIRSTELCAAATKCRQVVEMLRKHLSTYCSSASPCKHGNYATLFDTPTNDTEQLHTALHSAHLFALKALLQIYARLKQNDEYVSAAEDALHDSIMCSQPNGADATSSQYQNRIYFLCHKIGYILNNDPNVSSKLLDVDAMWGSILRTVSDMVEKYPPLLSTGVYQMLQCGSYYMSRAGLAPYAIDDARFPGGREGTDERSLAEKAHETYFAAKRAYDILLSRQPSVRCVVRADYLYMSLYCLFRAGICAASVAEAQLCLEACVSQYSEEWEANDNDLSACSCTQCNPETLEKLDEKLRVLLCEIRHHLGYVYMRSGKLKYAEEEVKSVISTLEDVNHYTRIQHALGLLATIFCVARRFGDMKEVMKRLESIDGSRDDVQRLRDLLEHTENQLTHRLSSLNDPIAVADEQASSNVETQWFRYVEFAVIVAVIGICIAWTFANQNEDFD